MAVLRKCIHCGYIQHIKYRKADGRLHWWVGCSKCKKEEAFIERPQLSQGEVEEMHAIYDRGASNGGA